MELKNLFFKDLASAQDYWARVGADSITSMEADLIWTQNEDAFRSLQTLLHDKGASHEVRIVLQELMYGFAHSVLCILDGATEMASHGRVYAVDEVGNRLGEGLHEEYPGFLFERGDNA